MSHELKQLDKAIEQLEKMPAKIQEIVKLAEAPWGDSYLISMSPIGELEREVENELRERVFERYMARKKEVSK